MIKFDILSKYFIANLALFQKGRILCQFFWNDHAHSKSCCLIKLKESSNISKKKLSVGQICKLSKM